MLTRFHSSFSFGASCAALLLAGAMSLWGCGGSGAGPSPGGKGDLGPLSDEGSAPPADMGPGVDGRGDPGAVDRGPVADVSSAEGADGGVGPDAGFLACPEPRGLLCSCASNDDCDTGWCVEAPEGSVCSKECLADCPPGFVCKQVSGVGGDILFLCVHPQARLCRPCGADADCGGLGDGLSARCVDLGAQGRFCGASCSADLPCPDDFACAQVSTVSGEASFQCVPTEGVCPCTAAMEGQTTGCVAEPNGLPCTGTRTCAAGVWTPCSALQPPEESCDGEDNDCDGGTDEGLGVQICGLGACEQEVSVCQDGKIVTCADVSLQPGDEICDGKDNDCDGGTDEDLGTLTCGLGICEKEIPACTKGVPGFCDPFEGKQAEVCDGDDNDCDGVIDQHWPEIDESCDGSDADDCKLGTWQCKPDGLGVICVDDEPLQVEVCDGKDNDCDTETDEVADLGTTTCGVGLCLKTVPNCEASKPKTCDPLEGALGEDLPDDLFLDVDCDGVDGESDNAIFVDESSGNDANPGTRQAPKRSIQAGIEAAAGQGKRDVYVSTGFYPESLQLRNGISVYGLYSAASAWSRAPGNTVTVSGGETAVSAQGLTEKTVLSGLVIKSQNAVAGGASSYGVRAKGSPGLVLRDLSIFAGRGADGDDGDPGLEGPPGGDGGTGGAGCEYGCNCTFIGVCVLELIGQSCGTCSRPAGGKAGSSGCGVPGGSGGPGGLAGSGGVAGKPGTGGVPGGKGALFQSGNGLKGGDGIKGKDGAHGPPAQLGLLNPTGFVPGDGVNGAPGFPGTAGGGGGSGGGDSTSCDLGSGCRTYGSAGGGGGAGGCGGGGGRGGRGGGGSFGVYLWGSAAAIDGVKIVTLGGGEGGAGGDGAKGSDGGAFGAPGDRGDNDDQGVGARGGAGGPGGHGGHGAGGAGGPSVGVFCGGGSAPTLSQVETKGLGQAGAGGASAKNPGPSGTRKDLQGCP